MTDDSITLPLDTPAQPNPPPRPHRTDPAVIEATARAMLPDVRAWLHEPWRYRSGPRSADILANLKEAISEEVDGYARAVVLSRLLWSPDAELVEILHAHDGYAEARAAVMAWVAANGIAPKHAIGDTVRCGWGREPDQTGEIVGVYAETAEYVIQTEKYRAEHPDQVRHASGYLIAFERVRPLE